MQPVKEVGRRTLANPHRAVALHIRVAADRQQSGTRLANVALRESEVDDLGNGGDRVVMLGQAHRPAEHSSIRVAEQLCRLGDLLAR